MGLCVLARVKKGAAVVCGAWRITFSILLAIFFSLGDFFFLLGHFFLVGKFSSGWVVPRKLKSTMFKLLQKLEKILGIRITKKL